MMSLAICISPPLPRPLFPLCSYRCGRGIPRDCGSFTVLSRRREQQRARVTGDHQSLTPDPEVTT
jgi:hypothetical protein